MKAVIFDLGDTLYQYEGIPLNWEAHYSTAITLFAQALGFSLLEEEISAAEECLRTFNTRLYPRDEEVTFDFIAMSFFQCWKREPVKDARKALAAFFSPFRGNLISFDDSHTCLKTLEQQGYKRGVLTDVPYGMPTSLVEEDLAMTGLDTEIDVLLTSGDLGFRKPNPGGLWKIIEEWSIDRSLSYYVGNEPKDMECAFNAGIRGIFLDRTCTSRQVGQWATITSLLELPDCLSN